MRTVLILGAAVIVVGVLAVILRWDDLTSDSSPVRAPVTDEPAAPSLPALDRNAVQGILIDDGKQKVQLARAGDQWVLPDRFDHPANPDRVKQLFDALVGLESAEHVASNPDRHHLFEVDEQKGKHLTLTGEGGNTIVDLIVGGVDLSGGRTMANARTYVRPADSVHVYAHQGRLLPVLNMMPRVWLNARFVPDLEPQKIQDAVMSATRLIVEYDDVELGAVPTPGVPPVERTGERVRLVVEAREVPIEVAEAATIGPEPAAPAEPKKTTERKWSIVEPESARGFEVNGPVVDGIVRQIVGGSFDDVKGRDPTKAGFGLEQPVIEVTVEQKDGTTRTLKIGALVPTEDGAQPQPGMGLRYGHLAGSAFVVSIPEYLARMFQKRPDELKLPGETMPGAPPRPNTGEILLPEEEGGENKPAEEGSKSPGGNEAGQRSAGGAKPPPGKN